MLIDVAIVTFAMFGMGTGGAILPGVYLFLTFGNGFRFGRFDLHLCQFLCLVGFVLVGVMVPAWREHPQFFLGWLISLLVLPFYVGALSEHINQARLRAEDELKEFLARGVAK